MVDKSATVKTVQELAARALAIQDACNLRAVLNCFLDTIRDLEAHKIHKGDKDLFTSAICQVMADKVAHLTATQNTKFTVLNAYDRVHQLAEGRT